MVEFHSVLRQSSNGSLDHQALAVNRWWRLGEHEEYHLRLGKRVAGGMMPGQRDQSSRKRPLVP